MRIPSRLNLFVVAVLLVALMLPGSWAMAQGDDDPEPEFNIEFEFTGTITSITDEAIVVDVEGVEFFLAPAGSFKPSQLEEGDVVQFDGILLNDDTIRVSELEVMEAEEGEGEEGEGEEEEPVDEGEEEEPVDEGEEGEEGEEEESAACMREDHPVVTALAEEFELEYDVVAGYFCDGYGLGNIARALMLSELSGMDVEELLGMANRGKAWKEILAEAEVGPGDLAPGRVVSANKNKNKNQEENQEQNQEENQEENGPGNSSNAPGRNRDDNSERGNSSNAPGQQKKN